MANVYEQVKQALQDIVAPEIKELRGEIKSLEIEIKRLDSRIDSLNEKIDSFRSEFHTEIKRLDEKIELGFEFRERFSALETKVATLTSR